MQNSSFQMFTLYMLIKQSSERTSSRDQFGWMFDTEKGCLGKMLKVDMLLHACRILAHVRGRQEDDKFEVSLGYMVNSKSSWAA